MLTMRNDGPLGPLGLGVCLDNGRLVLKHLVKHELEHVRKIRQP